MRNPEFKSENGKIELYNCDCMELMRQYPDKHFDLAIVDPPYGIGESGKTNHTRGNMAVAKDYKSFSGDDSEAPSLEYFAELRRVSKNQIVFGANHFIERIPISSSCWIVWDKDNSGDFADCELAWTSFSTAVRKFKWRWNGMLQEDMKSKETRIHPTQKPVALYQWLLKKYAKPEHLILDTHLGSASSVIACRNSANPIVACEIDSHYFGLAAERVKKELSQNLFF